MHSSHGRILCEKEEDLTWGFDYKPCLGRGSRGKNNGKHTGTWIATLPIFEPAYQILMAHGRITSGYIHVNGRHISVKGAIVYAEKN